VGGGRGFTYVTACFRVAVGDADPILTPVRRAIGWRRWQHSHRIRSVAE